ncbi:quinol:cytochrome c oxidoreductase quinone-binding subunit 2 [Mucilaginibacter gracilis]|uniref:Quinol:cytochrome c oxidoreductase quinone-binding subunit 2 n=1 Tax=Mucilaginibacter gracilis TaxID=423350 RepID=A0A495IZH8_9SPHI|nr:quinol:cytochrome C oxidoreductase [Mucilaginibacter gracilis]RKR81424.1 quinol:cytochrome c oxidoreductase quinone-binding subunit 2 [Mucilaginibacter gracilis]
METHNNFDARFEFTGKAKTYSIIAIVIGVVCVIGGLLTQTERTFDNLLLMGYYFTCVCLAGLFFCAVQYVAQAGWSASLIRVPQAFAKVLPYAAALLILIIGCGLVFTHTVPNEEGTGTHVAPYLYKLWATAGVAVKGNPNYDVILAGKHSFLNIPFFLGRLVVFLGVYSIFGYLLVKYSTTEDELGGMSNYAKSFKMACIFLVILGFTSPIFAFDTIMSLEAHWFSTMFGWYNFAAMWVSGLALITLTLILLRQNGYFSWITENHLHSLGQLIFGFSIFWTYVWFAQFLLIYYANLPEEAVYFYRRWEPEFKPWFWLNIIINFASPVLLLMSRDAKRLTSRLKYVCIILLVGHWLDYFMMIMPGTVGPQSNWFTEIGWIEPGIAIGFVGLFVFSSLTALSSFKSLAPKNHPFLQESLHHHI